MTRKISVTAACNAANKCVGKPVKFGQTSWQVFYYAPRETASRAMQADSYSKALALLTAAKTQQQVEAYSGCLRRAERARFYIRESRAGR